MTKLQIRDIVKPIGQTWEKKLEAIKTTKEGTTFLVGGLWWREEDLTLIQPVGTDWKVGAMVRFTNSIKDFDFVIGKIERFGDNDYWLMQEGLPHSGYLASYCKLIATNKCPEANDDWTGKIVRCISDRNFYKKAEWLPKIGSLYVVNFSSGDFLGLKEDPTPEADWSRSHFKLVGDVPQSLTLNNIFSSTYEETIQKQNQDTQILVNRIKKLKELITPVAQILDI